jgi:VIT1/CCC1 family predicted Fe2+/Mn2+ transporter
MQVQQIERHRAGRAGWLRAAVLGANDGLLSTASLVLGVPAAHGSRSNVLVAGFAALVAGAMSMASRRVCVSAFAKDTEDADPALERAELRTNDKGEREQLADIYVGRGLGSSRACAPSAS